MTKRSSSFGRILNRSDRAAIRQRKRNALGRKLALPTDKAELRKLCEQAADEHPGTRYPTSTLRFFAKPR